MLKSLFVVVTIAFVHLSCAQDSLLAYWNFDEIEANAIIDVSNGQVDTVQGFHKFVKGVRGNALKCDGFTTSISRSEEDSPAISGPFTIEAWIAPQAYPWNWSAIYNQEYKKARGIFFGLDGEGRIGLHAAIARQWRECISTDKIPFMQWSHIAGTFDPEEGLKVYINGKLSGELKVQGDLLYDREFPMQIARNHEPTPPSSLNRAGFVNVPVKFSFDGLIDELKISGNVLSEQQIRRNYENLRTNEKPDLTWRKLPEIPTKNSQFGAYYTKLSYDEDWDRLWRDDQFPDLVVTFDNQDYSMVFWKGTNYNLNLVTENGKWIADQSAETFGDFGCMEHMSDKQNRYSHIRLLENNDARVVVHWRYALTDINYTIANIDPVTNWGDWADEYYYIYPDGMAIRHYKIHGLDDGYSITEPALLCNPGERPEENIDMEAVTVVNLQGEESTHSFETWPSNQLQGGRFQNSVPNEVMSILNVKSRAKPFFIYEEPGKIGPYGGGKREIDYRLSKFHWRNHWPVSQIPSDGRFVLANDRVTSSAITSPEAGMKRETSDGPLEGRFVLGLSSESTDQLVDFAKFWLDAPEVVVASTSYTFEGFSRNDRAYHLSRNTADSNALKLSIAASPDRPLKNPVFIVHNWEGTEPTFILDGQELTAPTKVRYAIKRNLKSSDLIVWINTTLTESAKLTIER